MVHHRLKTVTAMIGYGNNQYNFVLHPLLTGAALLGVDPGSEEKN